MNSGQRHYNTWELSDYEAYVAAIRGGRDLDGVAEDLGRSREAVRSRAPYLLPHASSPSSATSCFQRLPDVLEDTAYEWVDNVRENHRAEGKPLWDADKDKALKQAWSSRSPAIPQLAQSVEATETQVADRLIRLGVASTYIDVDDHLRATNGELLAARAQLARNKQSVLLWVLTVTNHDHEHVHTSVHESRDAARRTYKTCRALTRAGLVAVRGIGLSPRGSSVKGPFARPHMVGCIQP